MHAGVWDKSADGRHEMRGRTLGIVGYGNIGSQLSVLAEALGMRVVFYDTADKLALGNARRCDTLDELLERGRDVVTLHVDGRPGNAGLFGEEQFARMRPAQPVPQPVAAASSSTTRRCAEHIAQRPPRRRRDRRLPGASPRRPGRRVRLRACAGCPT